MNKLFKMTEKYDKLKIKSLFKNYSSSVFFSYKGWTEDDYAVSILLYRNVLFIGIDERELLSQINIEQIGYEIDTMNNPVIPTIYEIAEQFNWSLPEYIIE